jgi:hypothetical protein
MWSTIGIAPASRATRLCAEAVLISLMVSGRGGPLAMKKNRSSKRARKAPKTILRLPDLDHAKAAVLNSLTCPDAQRGYRHAIDEFVDWYCSEPRLAFNKTVVLRYRVHLESRKLAPGTNNLRLGAVRRLPYEASDCGLLSPDLAAGIRRVKGVKKLGVRLGNWLRPNKAKPCGKRPMLSASKVNEIVLFCPCSSHADYEDTKSSS